MKKKALSLWVLPVVISNGLHIFKIKDMQGIHDIGLGKEWRLMCYG